MDPLDTLLWHAGVGASYRDYRGRRREVPREVRLRVLAAMGLPTAGPAVEAARWELDAAPWRERLAPFQVVPVGGTAELRFAPEELAGEHRYRVLPEGGAQALEGRFRPGELPELGEYWIGPRRYTARALSLPTLSPGYHRLAVAGGGRTAEGIVALHPERAPAPPGPGRLWGVAVHLYTLRSPRNLGVGDFADLEALCEALAPLGADFVLLNPLAARSGDPLWRDSPYTPSDRRFLDPLYLAAERLPGFVAGDLAAVASAAALRAAPLVDWPAVAAAKYALYGRIWERLGAAWRAPDFCAFCEAGGAALQRFCTWEAATNPWYGARRGEWRFAAWLQWQCRVQLAAAAARARVAGMAVGLVGDLPVGCAPGGHEAVAGGPLFAAAATLGAPPDPFAAAGQDWGLPAPIPLALRRDQFAHLRSLWRAAMGDLAALRIDHVMGLQRLWWCLHDRPGRDGCYVYYPFSALLGLLLLEAERAGCTLVGEDLGLVEPALRERLAAAGILGNALFYFERRADGGFLAPGEQRREALLQVTNHDVPPLAEWWGGGDLARRGDLGLLDGAAVAEAQAERARDRRRLLEALEGEGLAPPGADPEMPWSSALAAAVHRYCARSRARWLGVQLEDLDGVAEPLNVPGTSREYPNWRRKQRREVAEMLADPRVQEVLDGIRRERDRVPA
ncbi:MAG: hypothetical protein KatS3mg124_2470 [Porticoccaceae bacterium]|nr:MAG: hypothetical protein KatS3mg124_2470 [Porticoccaceae bacterium]